MKFLHLADLHIGKKIGEYPLYEDQRVVLTEAFSLAKKEDVDCVLMCGDIYDSSAPSAEAMDFYDWMLGLFHSLNKPLIIISGNHDSPERLHVASNILKQSDIFIITRLEDGLKPILINGVAFYALPYFRVGEVNRLLNKDYKNYEEALIGLFDAMNIDPDKPNVLLSHQSYLPQGGQLEASGSESSLTIVDRFIGGNECVNANILARFTYAALGHIHKATNVAPNARYAGALLKYHIDEANAFRSFTVVELKEGKSNIATHPIRLPHDLVILEGKLDDIIARDGNENDYVYAKLLDTEYVDSPMGKLKAKYPLAIGLEYRSLSSRKMEEPEYDDVESISKADLFGRFYEEYGGRCLEEDEKKLVESLLEKEGL